MFCFQLACDVTFKLKSQNKVIGKLGAHKFVLMARSPVFFAMFEGPMKETSDEIVISDIEGEPFRQFLRYFIFIDADNSKCFFEFTRFCIGNKSVDIHLWDFRPDGVVCMSSLSSHGDIPPLTRGPQTFSVGPQYASVMSDA